MNINIVSGLIKFNTLGQTVPSGAGWECMRKFTILCLPLSFLAATPAIAQDASPRFALTPFLAYQGGGEFEQTNTGSALKLDDSASFGLIFDIQLDPDRQVEIFYSRQETEADTAGLFVDEPVLNMNVDYLHFGGTFAFGDSDTARPYIVATVGASRFEPKAAGLDAETFLSFAFGGGVNLFPYKQVGLRLEGRLFGTLMNSNSALFCRTGGDTNFCAVSVNGDVFFQWQAIAGLVVRF